MKFILALFISTLTIVSHNTQAASVGQLQVTQRTITDYYGQPKKIQYISILGNMSLMLNQSIFDLINDKTPNFDPTLSTYLILDNDGGDFWNSRDFGKYIEELAKKIYSQSNSSLAIVLENQCSSMCIHALSSIIKRAHASPKAMSLIVNKNARLCFHAASDEGAEYDKINIKATQTYIDDLIEDYRGTKVSSDWIKKNNDIFQTTSLTCFTVRELVNQDFGLFDEQDLRSFLR